MAFTIVGETFPSRLYSPPIGQQRVEIGTSPAFTCYVKPLYSGDIAYSTGYVRRWCTLDQPGIKKAKPYKAITYNVGSIPKWKLTTYGGPPCCNNISGIQYLAYGSLIPVNGSSINGANSPGSFSINVPSSMRSAATVAAYNKLRDVKLDLAEFLGEFLETRNMVLRGFEKGARMLGMIAQRDYRGFARLAVGLQREKRWIRHPEYLALKGRLGKRQWGIIQDRLKRARKRGSKVLTDNPADHYFFWNFGIFPLLATIYDAKDTTLGSTRVLEIRGSSSVVETRPYQDLFNYDTQLEGTEIIRVRVLLKAYARPEDLALLNASQFGINSPIDVVRGMWAATPMSWLVDYFLNVGSWLEALSAPIGLTFSDGCISTRVSIEFTATKLKELKPWWPPVLVEPEGSGTYYINAFQRDVIGAFPFPGAPPVGRFLTPSQGLNIGMLLLQRLRK